MNKVTLNPPFIDRIMDIINANNIAWGFTLEQENCGIGNVVTMSWETKHKGYETTMTVVVTDEKDW